MSAWRLLFLLALSFSLVTTAAAMTGCSSEESTGETEVAQAEKETLEERKGPEPEEVPEEPEEKEVAQETAEVPGESVPESTPESSILQPEEKPGSAEKPGRKEYSKAKAPEGKQAFRWDFSKKYDFVYDFEQTAKMTSSGRTQEQRGTGTLLVKAQGDNTANIILSHITVKPDPGMEIPPVKIQGLTEDSQIPEANVSTHGSMELLFPLPAEALKVGESSSVPSKMGVRTSGVPVWARGTTNVTLKGYVTIESHVCAKFDVAINISDLDVPKDSPFKYEWLTKGNGVLYFDIEKRCFHSGELALSVSMTVGTGPDSPFGQTRQTMEIDSLAKFSRDREKEKEKNKK